MMEEVFVDEIYKRELLKIKKDVLENDMDWVGVYDGEEGVGKSVLSMQHAKLLDDKFNINNVVFTADDFIKLIKDPKIKKGTCIVLDEAFNAASSRNSLGQINKSMIALATEMRQKNLFVLIVLPTFFDLDKYFALWRTKALFHVYFTPKKERRYIAFDKLSKKKLYLNGKKTYNYSYPKSPFPPATFYNHYVVDERTYRLKKADAFKRRTVSNQARNWLLQRNSLIRFVLLNMKISQDEINQIFLKDNIKTVDRSVYSIILNEFIKDGDNIERIIEEKNQKEVISEVISNEN